MFLISKLVKMNIIPSKLLCNLRDVHARAGCILLILFSCGN